MIIANPAGGEVAPIEVIVPLEVDKQKLGEVMHAGIVRIVVSVIKYEIEF